MGYLKISRVLLNSSFWRSLAPAEKGILIDLMGMATYKPRLFNMNGYDIQLDSMEICISINSYAKNQGLSRSYVSRFLEALSIWNLVRKEVIYLSKVATNKMANKRTKDVTSKKSTKMHSKVTRLSFNEWIFAMDSGNLAKCPDMVGHEQSKPQADSHADLQYNKEVINKECFKEEIRRNSAYIVSSSQESKYVKYRKNWYSMESIAEMQIPNATDILNEWTRFSNRDQDDILSLLQKFTQRQKMFGLPEMTLDIFDKEFRKEMKRVFALKAAQQSEVKQTLKELGTDD